MTIDEIVVVVCGYYGLNHHRLLGGARSRTYTLARRMAIVLARELTVHSGGEVAERMGCADSAVIYAWRELQRQLADARVARDYAAIRRRLEEAA
ncbi:MAG: helix-turn-helix domain-containing protein [Sinobacteraceae bacterium]|nr:helix-turn-helix domain-containing protein [Nevskiaceae bacterium]